MHIQVQRLRIDLQIGDTGFFGRFPQRRRGESGVSLLAVPAELYPAPYPGMQGEQHVRAVVRDDHRRGGQVARHAGPGTGVRACGQECQERFAKRSLVGVAWLPAAQQLHRVRVDGSIRGGDV